MASENKVARRFLNRLQIIIDRPSRLLRDLELDGSSCFPLEDRCPVHGSPVRDNTLVQGRRLVLTCSHLLDPCSALEEQMEEFACLLWVITGSVLTSTGCPLSGVDPTSLLRGDKSHSAPASPCGGALSSSRSPVRGPVWCRRGTPPHGMCCIQSICCFFVLFVIGFAVDCTGMNGGRRPAI